MALVDATFSGTPAFSAPHLGFLRDGTTSLMSGGRPVGGGPTLNFKMRALQDPGPGYETWVVTGSPDFAGTSAGGPIQPGSAVIADQWEA